MDKNVTKNDVLIIFAKRWNEWKAHDKFKSFVSDGI